MSNIDFQISASNQTTIFDLPNDIMHNCTSKYLLEDKQINKIFNEKDDYYLQMLLFGEIKKLPYVIRYETNTYKIQNDVLKAYVNRILRGFKINEEVHSIIVNFDFLPLECEINFNNMWLEFQNKAINQYVNYIKVLTTKVIIYYSFMNLIMIISFTVQN